MKVKIALSMAILFALTGSFLHAADSLSLTKAREFALANSKTVQKTLLAVDASLLAEKAQTYAMLPQASLSLAGELDYPAAISSGLGLASSASASFVLSQTVYDGGEGAILEAIDRLATESARKEARAAYGEVLEATDDAYYSTLEAQAAVEAAESDLSASKIHLGIAQAKYESGIVIKSAVLEAQAETAAKETALSQAKRGLLVASAKLKNLTGQSGGPQSVDFSGYEALMTKISALGDGAVDGLISGLRTLGFAGNPGLALSSLAESQALKEIDAAKTGYLPEATVALSQGASYSGSGGLDLASKASLSVGVKIPLDFSATKNKVQSKTIAARQASLDKEETANTLNLEIQSAVYELIADVRSVSSSQKALDYAESHYEGVLELYRLSKASSSELSDAELLVSANRSSLISARYSFLSCLSRLKTLVGSENDSLLLSLIQ